MELYKWPSLTVPGECAFLSLMTIPNPRGRGSQMNMSSPLHQSVMIHLYMAEYRPSGPKDPDNASTRNGS